MAFKSKIKSNQVMSGSFGKVWFNGEKAANVKSFEAKIAIEYEDVDISEQLGKGRKMMGYEIEGTVVLHKTDSAILKLYGEGLRTGNLPEVSIVSALDDPAALGAERVQYTGVTFDEVQLAKFENKAVSEEEVPFKAEGFILLDLID